LKKVNKLLTYAAMLDTVHCCIRTIRDIADRIKGSGKCRTEVFVCVARLRQSYQNEPYQKL